LAMTKGDIERMQHALKSPFGLRLVGKVLGYKDWGAIHDEMAEHLRRPAKRKLILVPRNHLKSSVVTKAWTIQQVLRNPDIRILITNAVWENSRKYLKSIQHYLAPGQWMSRFFGNFQSYNWNQDECTVAMRKKILDAPTWATTGIEKEQTGQHYDLIVADDIVARENVSTPEQRQKVKLYYKDLLDLLEPNGTIVVVGTRWHQDDLYSDLLQDPNFDPFVRTAYKDETRQEVIFPEKFSLEYLDSLRSAKGSYEFSAQYLNNPIDESAADFKASWLKHYDAAKLPPLSFYLTVDPAISLSRDADYSALVVAGMSPSREIYVVDRIHRRMVPSDLVKAVFELVEKWRLTRIGLETVSFQLTLKYDLEREMRARGKFFSIDEMGRRANQEKKEARIRRLQPYFEQGLVYLRNDMKDVEDELLSFPRGKHDDLIDALSYQLDYLVPGSAHVQEHQYKPGTVGYAMKELDNRVMGDVYERYLSDLRPS